MTLRRHATPSLFLAGFAALAPLTGCGGRADSPTPPHVELAAPLASAFREEAKGDTGKARDAYLAVIDTASHAAHEPWQIPVTSAALDALVLGQVPALHDATRDSALIHRLPDARAARKAIAARLASAHAASDDPVTPSLLAHAIEVIARQDGDAPMAAKWRAASGCVQEATVIGPSNWAPLTGVREAGAFQAFNAPVDASYRGPGAFQPKVSPIAVRGFGCAIELMAQSATLGVRDVVVDVDVPTDQWIGLVVKSASALVVRAGGRLLVERTYDEGPGEVTRTVRVHSTHGLLRVVVRVALMQSDTLELAVLDAHGRPLTGRAPVAGERGTVDLSAAKVIVDRTPASRTDDERLASALGSLAQGDARAAERTLYDVRTRTPVKPELSLVYARAVDSAFDIPHVQRIERARTAYEHVLEAWPGSWEAICGSSTLAGSRRGQTEARLEALTVLDTRRAAAGDAPILDVFDAALSARERLFDRAREASGKARARLGGSVILTAAENAIDPRIGSERVAVECDDKRVQRKDGLGCYDAKKRVGDLAGAEAELKRIRALFNAPNRFLGLSLDDALVSGDMATARRVFDAMLPAARSLAAFATLAGHENAGAEATRERLRALAATARDAPMGLAPLYRSLGDDPLAPFEGMAERIVDADRKSPILPDAPTAILAHIERYEVDASGLVHSILYDVRRVSGTTDVEQNAQADMPIVAGRSTARALRRRIFKQDGRVLEPDRAPNASQAHADLAQLEQGDTVEAIYEGFGLPGDTGDIGIDTPDLLPERVAIHAASIELRIPAELRATLWAHPLLGPPVETKENGARVLRYSMKERPVRKLESGAPRLEQAVAVRLATMQWSDVGRGLRETLASFDERDPEVSDFARESAKGKAPKSRELVEAVVDAVGRAVRLSQPGALSDVGVGRALGPQSTSARGILADHEGSRSWLIVRTLRELGVPAEVAIAENEPFSGDDTFPPHFGRFLHPLVVAHVATGDVWIDADVAGPPLPAGRISPELRGRKALHASGAIEPLPKSDKNDERDEVDLRLTVDAKGDAQGSFTVILRGRDAQSIAEALYRIVGAERQRALRSIVLAWVPYADVDEVALSSSEGSWQVAVRASLRVGGYAQLAGGTWTLPGLEPLHDVFPNPRVSSLSTTYARQASRENALAIARAVQYHVHRRIELPKGASPQRTPAPYEVKTPYLEASRRIAVNGSVVEDDFVLGIPTGTVPAADYPAFAGHAQRTDDAFRASTWTKTP